MLRLLLLCGVIYGVYRLGNNKGYSEGTMDALYAVWDKGDKRKTFEEYLESLGIKVVYE